MERKDLEQMASTYQKVLEAAKQKLDPVNKKAVKKDFDDRKDKDIDNDGDVDSSDEYLHNRRKAVSKAVEEEINPDTMRLVMKYGKDDEKSRFRRYSNMQGLRPDEKRDRDKIIAVSRGRSKAVKNEEVELEEGVIDQVKDIVAKKQAKKISGVMVDMFTASAISQIYDKVNDANKAKMDKLPITKLADVAMKMMKKEEVELEEGVKEKALKALMTKALGGKRANPGYTSAVANNGDFVVKDGGGRIVGRIEAGKFEDPLKEANLDEAKDGDGANIVKDKPFKGKAMKKEPDSGKGISFANMRKSKVAKDADANPNRAKAYGEAKEVDEVLDRPGALDSYRKKADASGNKARNSATRKILRGPDKDGKRADHSDELKTMKKRNKGQDMADRVAAKQFRKSMGLGYSSKKEEVELEEAFVNVSSSHLLDLSMGYRTLIRAMSNNDSSKIKSAKEKIRRAESALGIKLPTYESVELEEAMDQKKFSAGAKAIKDYAQKNGGVDKKDFMEVSKLLDQIGRVNILQAGQLLSRLNRLVDGMDTDVRERIFVELKKVGLVESVNESNYGTQAQRLMSPLQKARQDKEKRDRDRDGKLKSTALPMRKKKNEMSEGEMTSDQKKKREEIVLAMKDREDEFKDKYGERWKEVMYATATKMAMKGEAVSENRNWSVYKRVLENRAMQAGNATPPESQMDANNQPYAGTKDSAKKMVDGHGGLMGTDSGIDGARAAADTAKNAAAGVTKGMGLNRPNDNKQGD